MSLSPTVSSRFRRREQLDDSEAPAPIQRERRSGRSRGFDINAGVRVAARDREGRERLLRYCARAPLSLERLRRSRERTEPQARAHSSKNAALSPPPDPAFEPSSRIPRAEPLKRVHDVDALACPCGGRLRFIALILDADSRPGHPRDSRPAEPPASDCQSTLARLSRRLTPRSPRSAPDRSNPATASPSEPTRVCAENGIEINYSTLENASCPGVLDQVIAVYANGALCYSAIWSAGLGCENEVRTWRDDYGETIATLYNVFDRSSGTAYDSFRCEGGEAYDFPRPSGVPLELVPFESAAACTEGRCSRAPGSCDVDSECPAHIPRCATAVNQCVVCLTDADCPAEQPLYTSGFEGGSACVGCVTHDDCAAGTYCMSNLINGTCETPDCENEPGLYTACSECRAERCTVPGEACADPFDAYVECNEQLCASNPEGCPGCDKGELGCAHQACEAAQYEVYECLETCTLCD
jgi:hypothetical protein